MRSGIIYGFVLLSIIASSCMKDDELWQRAEVAPADSPSGVFIVNEGNFMYNNASLSYYDTETNEVYNDIFFTTNGLPLGDVAISMSIRDSLGYVVVNNSGKINILDINNFEYRGKITGLTSPRYIHFINDTKAYVSDLYAQAISIINPALMELTGSIDLRNNASPYNQHPTEQMVEYGSYVFTNCWSFDNKIMLIDTYDDSVVDSMEVYLQPRSMVMDRYNSLWVLTDGGYEGNPLGYEAPALMRIDAATMSTEMVWRFDKGDWPSGLELNGRRDTLYFINGDVYRHAVLSESAPEVFIESPYNDSAAAGGGFYGLGVDPYSSEVYVADAIDNVQPGVVYRYSHAAVPVDTFRVGIMPGSFCFK